MLAEYLSEFAAAEKPTQPSQAGLAKMDIGPLQSLLIKLGEKLTTDGSFGPMTKAAWQRQASKYNQNNAFDRAGPTTAWVSTPTFNTLYQAAYVRTAAPSPTPAPAPAPSPPSTAIVPSRPGTVTKPVLELQDLLFGVGWTTKKLTRDGKYGPQTRGAWGVSARLRKLPDFFERVDGLNARVAQSTYDKIKADGGVTPAPVPTPVPPIVPGPVPVVPGTVNKSVAELLGLLYGVGWTTKKLANDPRFGPQVKGAWQGSAKLRGLPTRFERVDGRTARVEEVTYEAIKAKMPVKGAGPVLKTGWFTQQGPLGTFREGATLQVEIAENPSTGHHWDLVPTDVVSVIDSKYVDDPGPAMPGKGGKKTFTLRAQKTGSFRLASISPGRGTATTFANYSIVVLAGAQPKPTPKGTVDKPVSELLGILYGLGWTTKKLANDPRFGPQVKGAWQGSAGLRKLPKLFERVDGATARVDATTYEALRNKMPVPGKPTPKKTEPTKKTEPEKPVKPSLEGTVARPMLELQKLLQALKWRARTVPLNGKYSQSVANAWATSAKSRGLDQTFGKVDEKTARVNAKTYDTIKAEVSGKKPDKPKPKPKNELSVDARFLIGSATASVSAETVQQALAISAPLMTPPQTAVPVTGVWDSATTELFVKLVSDRDPGAARVQSAWREALGHLVSADGKSVKVSPKLAASLTGAAENWKKQQVEVKPDPVPPPTPGPTPGPTPEPGPGPGPGPGPAPEPGPGPGPAPEPVPEPAPEPGPPTPSPEGASAWSAAVDALASFTARAAAFEEAIEAGKARGPIHPAVQEAYANWIKSFDALKARIASMIESSPQLKSAIEAAGPSVGFAGYTNSLEAYFEDLEAVAEKVIELLRIPLAPEAGLSQSAAGVLKPLAGRVAGAAWVKLIEVMRLPVVTAAGTVVAGGAAVNNVLTGETQVYLTHEQAMAQLLAEGKITQDEYERRTKPPMGGTTIALLGLVALGGFALYLRNKRTPGGP